MGYVKEVSIQSRQRTEFIKLDTHIGQAIKESGLQDGICYVFVPHTTAGVTINEGADPAVVADALATLQHRVPRDSR